MKEEELMHYICSHDEKPVEWISSRTGASPDRIHELYHQAHIQGLYSSLKERPPKEIEIDYDLFMERLHESMPVDANHSLYSWSYKARVASAYFAAVYRGQSNIPTYYYVMKLARGIGVRAEWLAGLE